MEWVSVVVGCNCSSASGRKLFTLCKVHFVGTPSLPIEEKMAMPAKLGAFGHPIQISAAFVTSIFEIGAGDTAMVTAMKEN